MCMFAAELLCFCSIVWKCIYYLQSNRLLTYLKRPYTCNCVLQQIITHSQHTSNNTVLMYLRQDAITTGGRHAR